MTILAWIISILALLGSVLCLGIVIGFGIAQTNPSDEEPIDAAPDQGSELLARLRAGERC